VLITIFEATRRHRRSLLAATSALVVAVAVVAVLAPERVVGAVIRPALIAYTAVVVLLIAGAWLTPAPAALWVERHAFRTPPGVTGVYLSLLMVLFAATEVAVLLLADVAWWGDAAWRTVALAVYLLAVVRVVVDGWRGMGLRLRPDGLVADAVWGSRVVPWAALDVAEPVQLSRSGSVLTLRFSIPDLLAGRRRWRARYDVGNVDGAFLADAVAHYVAHPRDRTAIGTDDAYDRLLRAVGRAPADWALPGRESAGV
jgi:hypothetical protein